MEYRRKVYVVFFYIFLFIATKSFALDAAKDGPIYGDPEGLKRVEKLEAQLHNIEIIKEHPRIFINSETLNTYQERVKKLNYYPLEAVKVLAEKGNIVNLAFLYLMYEKDKPAAARQCADRVIKILMEKDSLSNDSRFIGQDIAKMCLAFDWTYNAMTDDERKIIIEKLSRLSGIDKRAGDIRKGLKQKGETFHREEWSFDSYNAWPEIALAYHNPNADFIYKARWNYDWYLGDAARMYAYAADGTPFEGYYYGADGAEWFLALKSATGINLIDGEFGWCKNAAYHVLYRLDLERKREILHHGVALGAAGCVSYREGTVAWKIIKWLGRTLPLAFDDPYVKWVVRKEIPISEWILTTVGFGGMGELKPIADILFDDLNSIEVELGKASYEDIPLARFFPGGNEAYMRTGWFNKPVVAGFRSSPAYTKTSHGDFDVNTFVIYKDGVISPDSGVYDAYSGQSNYFGYQKNTVAHNDILVINPFMPDDPKKLSGMKPDPGGVNRVFTRTFGAPSRFGLDDSFLHNPHANWAKIIDFKTTPKYDYVIGDAAKAYAGRLNEFLRTMVFVRKGNSAYIVIFDRVESNLPIHIKKSLLHLVSEPNMTGFLVQAKIPGHYEIFDADFFEAENAFKTSRIFCKVLLPLKKKLVKIGGEGYEFYVEGSKPRNFPISDKEIKRIEEQMGGVWQEAGTWRVETIPAKKQNRDYFMQVMYVTDIDDALNPDNIGLIDEGNAFTVNIKDDKLSEVKIRFNKTGTPEVKVEME